MHLFAPHDKKWIWEVDVGGGLSVMIEIHNIYPWFLQPLFPSYLLNPLIFQGDISRVRRLLDEGRVSVHETTEEGESLLSLACSAGYYELAQVTNQGYIYFRKYFGRLEK